MTRILAVLPLLALAALALAVLALPGLSGSAWGAPLCALTAGAGLHLHHAARLRGERAPRRVRVRR